MLRQVAAKLFVSVIAISATMAVEARCWQPHEREAAEVRYFQSMLMVGALRCRDGNRFIEDDYNRFVTRSRNALDDHNEIIYARFARDYGPDSDYYYDKFTTRLANDYSSRTDRRGFCAEAAALARISAGSHPHDIVVLAKSVVDDLPLRDPLCQEAGYGEPMAYPSSVRGGEPRSGVTYHLGTAPQEAVAATVTTSAPHSRVSTHPTGPASSVPAEVSIAASTSADVPAVKETQENAMANAIEALEQAADALRAAQGEAAQGAVVADVGLVVVDGVPTDNRPIVGVR